jgi:hypothetical protein
MQGKGGGVALRAYFVRMNPLFGAAKLSAWGRPLADKIRAFLMWRAELEVRNFAIVFDRQPFFDLGAT